MGARRLSVRIPTGSSRVPHRMFRFKVRWDLEHCGSAQPPTHQHHHTTAATTFDCSSRGKVLSGGHVSLHGQQVRWHARHNTPPSSLGDSAATQARIPASCKWQATSSLSVYGSLVFWVDPIKSLQHHLGFPSRPLSSFRLRMPTKGCDMERCHCEETRLGPPNSAFQNCTSGPV